MTLCCSIPLSFKAVFLRDSAIGMGDYENMSQRLLSVQVSRLLRLLATLHMHVDFIQQST